jgi:Protein kinase domain
VAITAGTRLGSYEIQSTLGAGGMGEVYRANDTALGRAVAIKVLPEEFVHDADRLARFEREARTLAALNHPNIAHIYGLERSTDMHALVMELVEGRVDSRFKWGAACIGGRPRSQCYLLCHLRVAFKTTVPGVRQGIDENEGG